MAFIKRSTFEVNERNIVRSLVSHRWFIQKFNVMMPNCYIASDNECDLFCIQQNMISHEFEVKISRSDFLKDSKKMIQYREIDRENSDLFYGDEWERWVANGRKEGEEPWKMNKIDAYGEGYGTPNYFWYVFGPEVKFSDEEIPEWAGVIKISKTGFISFHKKATMIHKKKIDSDLYVKVLKKGYSRYIDKFRGWNE